MIRVAVTPLVENRNVRVFVVLAVSAVSTAYFFAVSIPRAMVTRWRSR